MGASQHHWRTGAPCALFGISTLRMRQFSCGTAIYGIDVGQRLDIQAIQVAWPSGGGPTSDASNLPRFHAFPPLQWLLDASFRPTAQKMLLRYCRTTVTR